MICQHINEIEKPKPTALSEAAKPRLSLQGIRVMVVDDCQYIRKFYGAVLGRFGAEVFSAGSVDEALNLVSFVDPDVLLVDIFMPDKNGFELMRALTEGNGPHRLIPAAAISTLGDEWEKEALRVGFSRVLTKPVDPHTLVQIVQSLAKAEAAGWNQ